MSVTKSTVFTIGFSVVYFLFFRFFVELRFQENDDYVMMLLANGDYDGVASSYIVFINYFLGSAFAFLYEYTDAVDWYPFVFLALQSLCFGILTVYAMRQHRSFRDGQVAIYVVILALLIVCTVQLQFTTLAGIALATGLWAIIRAPGAVVIGAGIVLVVSGVLLRFEAAIFAAIICGPFLMGDIMRRSNDARRYGLLAASFVAAIGLHFIGERIYQQTAPAYYEFNALRGAINDNPHAELAPHELPEGVSPNDFELLKQFFSDADVIDLDELRALRAAVAGREAQIGPKEIFAKTKALARKTEILLTVALSVVFLFALASRNAVLSMGFGAIVLLAVFVYVTNTATLKDRVIYCGIFALLVSALHLPSLERGRLSVLGVIGLAALFALYWGSVSVDRLKDSWREADAYRQQTDLMSQWEGDVVVFKNHFRIEGARVLPLKNALLEGRVFFKGWMVGHPSNARYRRHEDLLSQDVVVLMKTDEVPVAAELITRSLVQNYGKIVRIETVHQDAQTSLIAFREVVE